MAVQYLTVAALKSELSSADAGAGTAAQLSEAQLTGVIVRASNRVNAYVGSVFDTDPLTPAADVPDMLVDLATQLAVYYATLIYYKGKPVPPQHPAYLGYQDAMGTLRDINSGKIRIDPQPAGGISEVPLILNPNGSGVIFTHDDSNTHLDSQGVLEAGSRSWGDPWRTRTGA